MNIWQQFQQLLPKDVVMAGTVSAFSNEVYTVTLPSGGSIPARSASAFSIGSSVFVKNGQITGVAPSLGAITTIEV